MLNGCVFAQEGWLCKDKSAWKGMIVGKDCFVCFNHIQLLMEIMCKWNMKIPSSGKALLICNFQQTM